MGFTFSEDGECKVCGQHTAKYCDSCRQYICDEHQIQVKVKGAAKYRIFCKECYEKGKRPKNSPLPGLHPHYNLS